MGTSGIVVSVDLDWFNGRRDAARGLDRLLGHIPCDVPAVLTVEHHEFLPHLRRWVGNGTVPTPFDLLLVDEHHDCYVHEPPYDPGGEGTDCAVWGYRLPPGWCHRYTWVCNDNSDSFDGDWSAASRWLRKNRGTECSRRRRHRLSELGTPIVAAAFCVSPDYVCGDLTDELDGLIEAVAGHFRLAIVPRRVGDPGKVNGWHMARRRLQRGASQRVITASDIP